MTTAANDSSGSALDRVIGLIELRGAGSRPIVIAIDGKSGAGKSTFAAALAERTGAALIEGDDFFVGGVDLAGDDPASRARRCIDWKRQREVLAALRAGRHATYRAFDWQAFNGKLCDEAAQIEPKPIIILEGVYAARRELADLVDLRVLLEAAESVRAERLLLREGAIGQWERQWHEAEDWYFRQAVRPADFDLILVNR